MEKTDLQAEINAAQADEATDEELGLSGEDSENSESDIVADESGEVSQGTSEEIVVGQHRFRSQDELIGFTKALSETVGRQGNELGQLRKQAAAAEQVPAEEADADLEKQITEALESDPSKAAKLLLEVADKRAENKLIGYMAEQEFWSDFYEENPGFRLSKKKIEAYTNKALLSEMQGMSRDEQMEHIKKSWTELTGMQSSNDNGRKVVTPKASRGTGPAPKAQSTSKTTEKSKEKPSDIFARLNYNNKF